MSGVTDRLEHSGSAGPTTLAAEASPSSMALTLADGTGYPTGAVGRFVLTLGRGTTDEERVLCSARTGNSVTVDERGWDGTVARTHAAGSAAEHTYSATEADQANDHSSSTAAHGTNGAVVGTTDTQTLANKTLTTPVINGAAMTGTVSGSPVFSGAPTFDGALGIDDFTNAQHDHNDADSGGNIPQSAVTALVSDLAGKSPTGHTHTQATSHGSPDTDSAPSALHHTLGTGANQAAPGNHTHPLTPIEASITGGNSIHSGSPGGVDIAMLAMTGVVAGRSYLVLWTVRGMQSSVGGTTVRAEVWLEAVGPITGGRKRVGTDAANDCDGFDMIGVWTPSFNDEVLSLQGTYLGGAATLTLTGMYAIAIPLRA